MRVDEGASVVEQTRSVLHLIEDCGEAQALKKRAGIRTNAVLDIGIFKQDVLGFGNGLAQERGLSGAAWAGDDQSREMAKSVVYHSGEFSRNRHND